MMNETIHTIMTRRSCRCFDPQRMPSDEVLQQIAEAGTWAPTGKGLQNPLIIVVTNKALRDRISRMNAEILGTTSDRPLLWGALHDDCGSEALAQRGV